MDPSSDVFYAVLVSPEARQANEGNLEPTNLVSPDRSRIVDLCKKYKGSRFKSFRTYDDALKYAIEDEINSSTNGISSNSTTKTTTISITNVAAEVAPPFPSLDVKNLNEFKRAIESKHLAKVQTMVDINPRYLISYSSDSPTILKQATRYNAVHIAVCAKAPDILDYILTTINSLTFIKRCYPSFDEESIIEKRNHLLDLFLNTPEKIAFNSSLHLACKNGDLKCIKILLNYVPVIETNCKNKFGLQPKDVVQDPNLKSQMDQILNECMFVTVERNEDDLDVKINEPCHGRKSLNLSPVPNKNVTRVSAIVGPMTPDRAKLLYEKLKSPKKCTDQQRSIRLRDPMRGVEKVARDLSYRLHVPCQEFWPFLDDYLDISSPEGLNRLDQHLKKQHDKLLMDDISAAFGKLMIGPSGDERAPSPKENGHDCEPSSDSQSTEQPEEVFFDTVEEEDDDDIYYTPPTTPNGKIVQVQQFFVNGQSIGQMDRDVFSALELAIEQSAFSIEEKRQSHPFLFHWFEQLNKKDVH